MAIILKRCPKCGERKPATVEFFYKGAKWRDGFKPYCKVCQIAQAVEYNRRNPEKALANKRKWRRRNRAYYSIIRRQPKYRAKSSAYKKRRRKLNLEYHRAMDRRYARIRRQTPAGRLNSRMSAQLRRYLRDGKEGRSWKSLVEYTVDDLRAHIERQFLPRMGWHNIDKWHIDHIVPLASFTYMSASDPEFRAAWALSNLRPLWKRMNMKKHAKRLYLL